MALPTLADAADAVHQLPRIAADVMEEAVREATAVMKEEFWFAAPSRTGRLREAVKSRVTGHGFKTKGRVVAGGFANILIPGAQAHSLKPKKKKAMSWSGASHPSGSARHPGIRPNPFVARAIDIAQPKVDRIFQDAGARVVQGATKNLRARRRR